MGQRDYRRFYESYHKEIRHHPVEVLKQARRIETIRRLMPDRPGEILIVGCGQGDELAVSPGRTTAIDLALTGVLAAKSKTNAATPAQGDACALPFRSGSFDTVICSEVIEHIPDADVALAEFSRVLKPIGTLVLSTPNSWSLFGLARKVGELVTGKPVTSGGQPYDRWRTPPELEALLAPSFVIRKVLGSWYYPPFGRGRRQLSTRVSVPVVKSTLRLERGLGRRLPRLGHIIAIQASKNRTALRTRNLVHRSEK